MSLKETLPPDILEVKTTAENLQSTVLWIGD